MNHQETVRLVAVVRALCPTQKFDEMTPDAWAIVMGDIRYTDAEEAIKVIYREHGNDQEWGGRRIEADDIIREVRRIRQRRLDQHPIVDPPADLEPADYKRWLQGVRQQIADGRTIQTPELPSRDMSELRAIDKRPA